MNLSDGFHQTQRNELNRKRLQLAPAPFSSNLFETSNDRWSSLDDRIHSVTRCTSQPWFSQIGPYHLFRDNERYLYSSIDFRTMIASITVDQLPRSTCHLRIPSPSLSPIYYHLNRVHYLTTSSTVMYCRPTLVTKRYHGLPYHLWSITFIYYLTVHISWRLWRTSLLCTLTHNRLSPSRVIQMSNITIALLWRLY